MHEIEIIIILNKRIYKIFKHSKQKPSEFCKSELHMHNVKSYDFVHNYFKDSISLIRAIKEYRRIAKIQKDKYTLLDLLKTKSSKSPPLHIQSGALLCFIEKGISVQSPQSTASYRQM